MPYPKPPARIKDLPDHAQSIWTAAFNAAFKQYGGDEGKASAVAYAAVKKAGYSQDDQGEWHKESESSMENVKCAKCGEEYSKDAGKCPKCGSEEIAQPEEESAVEPTQPQSDEKPKEEPKKESVRALVFGEPMFLRESVIDANSKTVGVTLIKPGWSANGRYYSPETLAKALAVFEGTKCYIDHPTLSEDKDRPERSVADIAGYYRNVRQAQDGAVRGDLVLIGKRGDEIMPLIAEAIANKPDLIGLSINALGRTRMGEVDGQQGVIVEELVKSFGTDIVTTPSAGGRFDRLMQSGDEMTTALMQSLSYDEWRSANSDYVARIKKEMRTARKDELEGAAIKEAETLKATLTEKDAVISEKDTAIAKLNEAITGLEKTLADKEREYASRARAITAKLKLLESKLPETWCETIKPQLAQLDDAAMDKLIEAEKKKYFSNREPVRVQNAGAGNTVDYRDPGVVGVLEALKVNGAVYPVEGESPEQYKLRKEKMTRK